MFKNKKWLRGLMIFALALALVLALTQAMGGFELAKRLINRHRALGSIEDGELRAAMLDMLDRNPEAEGFVDGFEAITMS